MNILYYAIMLAGTAGLFVGIIVGVALKKRRDKKVVDDFLDECQQAIKAVQESPECCVSIEKIEEPVKKITKKKVSKKKASKKVSKKKVSKKKVSKKKV